MSFLKKNQYSNFPATSNYWNIEKVDIESIVVFFKKIGQMTPLKKI